ncbi:MAG: hypothetical protein QXV03_08095, partial [Sulfolobales archaeon]
ILMISYKYPPQPIIESLKYRLRTLGVDEDAVEGVVSKYFKVVSLNPFGFSVSQLVIRENTIIDSENPDIVVFHGVEIPRAGVPIARHIKELYNQMNYLKQRGVLVIRIAAYTNRESYSLESRIGEALLRFYYDVSSGSSVRYKAFAYRRNSLPTIISSDELAKCVEESIEVIKKYTKKPSL